MIIAIRKMEPGKKSKQKKKLKRKPRPPRLRLKYNRL